MNQTEKMLHLDRDLFYEAVNFTAAETGFSPRLVEKDYFATLVLSAFSSSGDVLVFKGGTCLAKVHSKFYRLSEDLDFMISVLPDCTRGNRRKLICFAKQAFSGLTEKIEGLFVDKNFSGANKSTQYLGSLAYSSVVYNENESIKIEVSLREPLLTEAEYLSAETLLINPVSKKPFLEPISILCMSLQEAMAEKFRAAFSRRRVAIRDFFDIDRLISHGSVKLDDPAFIELVQKKLSIDGNDSVRLDVQRISKLRKQVETRLKPVLTPLDFKAFSLDRAISYVENISNILDIPVQVDPKNAPP